MNILVNLSDLLCFDPGDLLTKEVIFFVKFVINEILFIRGFFPQTGLFRRVSRYLQYCKSHWETIIYRWGGGWRWTGGTRSATPPFWVFLKLKRQMRIEHCTRYHRRSISDSICLWITLFFFCSWISPRLGFSRIFSMQTYISLILLGGTYLETGEGSGAQRPACVWMSLKRQRRTAHWRVALVSYIYILT